MSLSLSCRIKSHCSRNPDADEAIAEIVAAIDDGDLRAALVFVRSDLDLDAISISLKSRIVSTVICCTSGGNLGPGGFEHATVCAVGFNGPDFHVASYLVDQLSTGGRVEARFGSAPINLEGSGQLQVTMARLADHVESDLSSSEGPRRCFGILLADGLCMKEEWLGAQLYQHLGDVPIVGGSASDSFRFEKTAVYFDGAFHQDAMVFATVRTSLPFHVFKAQHFVPSGRRVVVTEGDESLRTVYEFDGLPAVEAYARAVGVSMNDVTPAVLSRYPLLLKRGDESFIRSVRDVGTDGSMRFYCAIERGLVLSLGEAIEPIDIVEDCFEDVRRRIGEPTVILGFDCALRRLEFEHLGIDAKIGRIYADNHVIGFSTYGEQYDGIHVNQTLTGVAIGRAQ